MKDSKDFQDQLTVVVGALFDPSPTSIAASGDIDTPAFAHNIDKYYNQKKQSKYEYSMKFSALVASLAISSAAAISVDTLKTAVHDEIQSTLHARRVMMGKIQFNHRHLQDEATACDAAFVALLEDEALADATVAYVIAYEAQSDNLDVSQCTLSGNTYSCNFAANAPSTADLSSACTAAGGTVESFDSDMSCTVTSEGQTVSFNFDFAPLSICVPTVEGEDCKAEAQATSDEVDADIEANMEAALDFANLPGDCEVGAGVIPGSAGHSACSFAALAGAAAATAFFLM